MELRDILIILAVTRAKYQYVYSCESYRGRTRKARGSSPYRSGASIDLLVGLKRPQISAEPSTARELHVAEWPFILIGSVALMGGVLLCLTALFG